MRKAELSRETKETKIVVKIDLDGGIKSEISTPVNFFNHMLDTFFKHSNIGAKIIAKGDLVHHIIEDVGIVLGKAFKKALGKKEGINRFGDALVPMDDALAQSAVDLGGRSYCVISARFTRAGIDDTPIEDLLHFLSTFAENAEINLHTRIIYGNNDHHKMEAIFKSLALAIKEAVKVTGKEIPSTKGVI
ncbi:MAG: imidazoleglycerol-phosphate dehydratase HisB [Candidatus Odinarchaeia archaeon]